MHTPTQPASRAPIRSGVEAHQALAAAADDLLSQTAAFLESLPADVISGPSARIRGGTIGKHIRHTLDHYIAAISGLSGAVVDYDRRERGGDVESDVAAAVQAVCEVRAAIRAIEPAAYAHTVHVRVLVAGHGPEPVEAEFQSTFARELAFVTHHAVHHHAMIKCIAEEFGTRPGDDFGKAPSTVRHERAGAAG